jgi:simple sugar transport system substrate-binding protein
MFESLFRRNAGGRIACLLLVFAVLFCGCAEKEEQEDSPALLLGFSQLGTESAWRSGNTRDIEEKAAASGVSLMLENANRKQENQIAAIRRFIAYRVDVIAF